MTPSILWVASEAAPYAKTGGLADVGGALPAALRQAGADVRLCLPYYRGIVAAAVGPSAHGRIDVLGHTLLVLEANEPAHGVPTYFLDCPLLFARRELYGELGGSYPDNAERFAVFSAAAVELGLRLGCDVLHLHDWQAALGSLYLRLLEQREPLKQRTVLTLHNLAYQGAFPAHLLPALGLPAALSAPQFLGQDGEINFLKGGIAAADRVTTVSPTYAREILTKEGGFGLDAVLGSLPTPPVGILNGLDVEAWTPSTNRHLAASFDAQDLTGKRECKRALIERLGLEARYLELPLAISVGRLTEQKGTDLMIDAVWQLMERTPFAFVVLGRGEERLEARLAELGARFRRSVRTVTSFDPPLAHQYIAAGDLLLAPSLSEPCGLTQLQAMRYGTVPVVRRTGGLADTVSDGQTGFVFSPPTGAALAEVLERALGLYAADRPAFLTIARRAMMQDFSWAAQVPRYLELYASVLASKRAPLADLPPPAPFIDWGPPLPYRHGENIVSVVAQTPRRLFAYYEVSNDPPIPNAPIRNLRAVLVALSTGQEYPLGPANQPAGEFWIGAEPRQRYRVELRQGERMVLRSSVVRTPAEQPSERTDATWVKRSSLWKDLAGTKTFTPYSAAGPKARAEWSR